MCQSRSIWFVGACFHSQLRWCRTESYCWMAANRPRVSYKSFRHLTDKTSRASSSTSSKPSLGVMATVFIKGNGRHFLEHFALYRRGMAIYLKTYWLSLNCKRILQLIFTAFWCKTVLPIDASWHRQTWLPPLFLRLLARIFLADFRTWPPHNCVADNASHSLFSSSFSQKEKPSPWPKGYNPQGPITLQAIYLFQTRAYLWLASSYWLQFSVLVGLFWAFIFVQSSVGQHIP